MSDFDIGLAMFAAALVLIALRMLVGGVGFATIGGWDRLFATLNSMTFSRFSSDTLSVIPLFLLMGDFATKGGMNRALFGCARAWMGHWRGGLAVATIGGCAAFGAICGSSLATAATMSQVAGPEMRRHGYSNALTTGTLAAGGTLGILIPPGVILVIYAIYTEMSIGTLFVAAVIPGLIATAGYMVVVNIYARLYPASAPPAPRMSYRERFRATGEVWPVALVFILVVTGILAVTLGGMRWQGLRESLLSTTVTTGLIFVVLLGAELFSAALALSRLPSELSAVVATFDVAPIVILLLTLPIFIPLMLSLDFGLGREQVLVWFGILVLMSVEVGMISPPFGLNLFVINAMAKDVPMGETYRGVMGFVASDFVRIILLALVPALALWLPGLW